MDTNPDHFTPLALRVRGNYKLCLQMLYTEYNLITYLGGIIGRKQCSILLLRVVLCKTKFFVNFIYTDMEANGEISLEHLFTFS